MFQGDISNFSPADLLVFLAHLNKEGVLTVRHPDESLCFAFSRGSVIDAHSGPVDRWILDTLCHRGAVDGAALGQVERAKRETDLPLPQIFEQVPGITPADVADALAEGLREAVFRLFLWETGEFRFAETAVDANRFTAPCDCNALAMDVSREVDEYREVLRRLGSVAQVVVATPEAAGAAAAAGAQRYVLEHAQGDRSLEELLLRGPFRTHALAQAVAAAQERGWIRLVPPAADTAPDTAGAAGQDGFQLFRRALRGVLTAPDLETRIREMAAFCRDTCACTLLLAVRDGQVVRCKSYQRDDRGGVRPVDRRDPGVRLADDPVFERVLASGRPFYGRVFPSAALQALGVALPDGDCALVPFGALDGPRLLIYAAMAGETEIPGPLHYLELMGWHVHAPAAPGEAGAPAPAAETPAANRAEDPGLQRLVASIKELPAMPEVVTTVLKQLSDPDCALGTLTDTLSRDPALVARLIKVANSSLYGTNKEFTSLNQALVRLGFRTIRSLVIAASSRSLFPMNDTQVGLWGKALWDHSVECGVAAKWVAKRTGYPDPDEAFAAGVLHDVGKVIILLNLPDDFRSILDVMRHEDVDSRAAERKVLGVDHGQVASWLMERWDMPPALVAAIVGHHEPDAADEHAHLARIVGCGDALSHHVGAGLPWGGSVSADEAAGYLSALDLEPSSLMELQELGLAGVAEDEDLIPVPDLEG